MLFKVTTLILDAFFYPGSECHAGGDDIVFRHGLSGFESFDVDMSPDGEI